MRDQAGRSDARLPGGGDAVDRFPRLPQRRSRIALRADQGRHRRTILIALAGNVVIAIAKLIAGLLAGSAAMLAESGHSFADSINEVLLALSLRSSGKPADPAHPLGHGRERFLWAFLAAITSFVVGGCLSIGLAVRQLSLHGSPRDQTLAWVVLGIAFIADGVSFLQSCGQTRIEANEQKKSVWRYLRQTSDPVLRAILVEDMAGLLGVVLAAGGLLASRLVGDSAPDAIASLLIGILLALTAIGLARPLADFLVGRSLPPEALKAILKLMDASPAIDAVIGVQAVYIGPGEAVVAAKINPASISVDDFAAAMDDLDHQIRDAVPSVADVFVDVTAWRPENQNRV